MDFFPRFIGCLRCLNGAGPWWLSSNMAGFELRFSRLQLSVCLKKFHHSVANYYWDCIVTFLFSFFFDHVELVRPVLVRLFVSYEFVGPCIRWHEPECTGFLLGLFRSRLHRFWVSLDFECFFVSFFCPLLRSANRVLPSCLWPMISSWNEIYRASDRAPIHFLAVVRVVEKKSWSPPSPHRSDCLTSNAVPAAVALFRGSCPRGHLSFHDRWIVLRFYPSGIFGMCLRTYRLILFFKYNFNQRSLG